MVEKCSPVKSNKMLRNYFKIGIRHLAKNKLSSSINILGLALAVGCCMVVFTFFDWSIHLDRFSPQNQQPVCYRKDFQSKWQRSIVGRLTSANGSYAENRIPANKKCREIKKYRGDY
ncbi:MAG: hypothetical protein WDM78_01785 [Puia sp.]